jgi:hypothetical protein
LEAPEVLVTVPPPVPDGLILPDVEALIRASGANRRMTADRVAKELADILVRPGGGLDPERLRRSGCRRLFAVSLPPT